MNNSMTLYKQWCNLAVKDLELQAELKAMSKDVDVIEDAFYKNLTFGTGGLRGLLGAGTNRMNLYTINKATKGLARYLCKYFENPSCALAYDSRKKSDFFAKITAVTLASQGVLVYLYDTLMPTPLLSYAVRNLNCSGGVMITASHNPAQYNGYKVYGADGCQITLDVAQEIADFIEKEDIFPFEEQLSFETYLKNLQIRYIPQELIQQYYKQVLSLRMSTCATPLEVVYSPLNGTGNIPVRTVLSKLGNVQLTLVKEQELPDENFTTCPYPNPEVKETMSLAAELAAQKKADLFLATDPDCDRVGAGLICEGNIRLISGNEMGILLLEYICKQQLANNTMPKKPLAIKTIVSTEMANALAEEYQLELLNVLTGFKFIGEQITILEEKKQENRFIFGFEESYGYLCGSFVRDKDAVIASMLICEMAAYYKAQGKSLLNVLDETYEKYGYYVQNLLSFAFEGAHGMQKMDLVMEEIRKLQGGEFLGKEIVSMTDYEKDDTGLPKSKVLRLQLKDNCHVVVRPSGTEPMLKMYFTAVGKDLADAKEKLEALCQSGKQYIQAGKL